MQVIFLNIFNLIKYCFVIFHHFAKFKVFTNLQQPKYFLFIIKLIPYFLFYSFTMIDRKAKNSNRNRKIEALI